MQLISRKCSFDASHRVLNERMKCFNQHGHLYQTTLTFAFEKQEEIGYALDFKEIKRVYCQWIDDTLDHAAIHNPKDTDFIAPCLKHKTKLWLMSLNGEGEYCNPSVENIAKEVFLAMQVLTESYPLLKIESVEIYETLNCFTTCFNNSITKQERENWFSVHYEEMKKYSSSKGVVEYDDRKLK